MDPNPRQLVRRFVPVDVSRLCNVSLIEAANYLNEMSGKLPPDAVLETHWYDYEIMELEFEWYEEETDAEYQYRLDRQPHRFK